jgi:hypothetical protein
MLLILLHTIWMLLSHGHLLVLLSYSHLKVGCAAVYTRPSPEANLAANCSGKVADMFINNVHLLSGFQPDLQHVGMALNSKHENHIALFLVVENSTENV